MKKSYFPEGGIWLKGNIHSHSTVSDGMFTPEQLALSLIHICIASRSRFPYGGTRTGSARSDDIFFSILP